MIDKDKLTKIAEDLGVEIKFDTSKPSGVYDKSDNSFITYEDLFKDVFENNYIKGD